MRAHFYIQLVLCVGMTACMESKRDSVWETYDVRHPVPANSQVPDGYARQYDQYIDNDSYYSTPGCAGIEGPSCLRPE